MTVASKEKKGGFFFTRLLSHEGEGGFCETHQTAAIGVRAGSKISLSRSGGFPEQDIPSLSAMGRGQAPGPWEAPKCTFALFALLHFLHFLHFLGLGLGGGRRGRPKGR